MKIVVVGGSGLIGKKTVEILRKQGHEVISASTKSGVNVITEEGLADAVKNADAVVDVLNSPSWEDNDVLEFFKRSTANLLKAESDAGVKHHVALSVVGTARLQESGYFRAKQAQEDLIKAGHVPYTIVQATQFFEFLGGIADFGADSDGKVHLSTGALQPISGDDVAEIMAAVASGKPENSTIEIAGPERGRLCDMVMKQMKANKDNREVVSRADAGYYGLQLDEQSLVPGKDARLGQTKLDDWLCTTVK